ncbi:MAG TPA: metalloregulator ArsR/SmtB family transcription factor [Acidimicrobiia bacterium]|nr:metalloregulator ArsR/SmtB family transcription factor [Acidimicrobiia bacterium]
MGRRPPDAAATDRLFHALADPTRRDIVERSMRGGLSVSGLAQKYAMSFAAVQKHVAVLERAGLVTKERRGREQVVRTNVQGIRQAQRLLDRWEAVWRDRIDRFGEVLVDQSGGTTT